MNGINRPTNSKVTILRRFRNDLLAHAHPSITIARSANTCCLFGLSWGSRGDKHVEGKVRERGRELTNTYFQCHICNTEFSSWHVNNLLILSIMFRKDAQNRPMSSKNPDICIFWCTLLLLLCTFIFMHMSLARPREYSLTLSHFAIIGDFRNVFKLMDISSALSPVISHFIHLLLSMWDLLLVSTFHTLVVATLDKPRTSFAVVKNNLLLTEYAWNLNTLRKSPIVFSNLWIVDFTTRQQ